MRGNWNNLGVRMRRIEDGIKKMGDDEPIFCLYRSADYDCLALLMKNDVLLFDTEEEATNYLDQRYPKGDEIILIVDTWREIELERGITDSLEEKKIIDKRKKEKK